MISRSERSKGASYVVRKDRGLLTSWSAKCSVSTCKELSRRNFSLAKIDLKVMITSPFILRFKQAISDASISALARASKTDFAVVLVLSLMSMEHVKTRGATIPMGKLEKKVRTLKKGHALNPSLIPNGMGNQQKKDHWLSLPAGTHSRSNRKKHNANILTKCGPHKRKKKVHQKSKATPPVKKPVALSRTCKSRADTKVRDKIPHQVSFFCV